MDTPEHPTPPVDPDDEPVAATAGEESHQDPDRLRGGEADAPRDPHDDFADDETIDDLETEEVEHDGSGS